MSRMRVFLNAHYIPTAFLLHTALVAGTIDPTEVNRDFSKVYERITLLCQKEDITFGNCLINWLRCYYKKDCGREYMLMKLICSVSSNQSLPAHEPPECREPAGNEASLLVSPLVVAGIVIGLVLLLSCVTIVVGSLRKDGRLRNPHLRARHASDGLSYGGSVGELRSSCVEEFPPGLDLNSFVETLSQTDIMYPDSPPHYEDCVGPGATQIYVPTDNPPPYSLTDRCPGGDLLATHVVLEMDALSGGASWVTAGRAARYRVALQELRRPVSSISLSALPLEDAPPYEAVVGGLNRPLPLIPLDPFKRAPVGGGPQMPDSYRTLESGPLSPATA